RRAQALREQGYPQLLQQPPEIVEAGVGPAATLLAAATIAGEQRGQFRHGARIAARVLAQGIEPSADRAEVAWKMAQRRRGRGHDEVARHEPAELFLDIGARLRKGPAEGRQLARERLVFLENLQQQPCELLADEGKPAAGVVDALLELPRVGR